MFRLITVSGDTVRLDEEGVSRMLTNACNRAGSPLVVEGVASDGERVHFICTSRAEDAPMPVYRLSQVGELGTEAELAAELRSRYDSGFRTAGGFRIAGGYWILTEKSLPEEDE